jgi:hypothetical protein
MKTPQAIMGIALVVLVFLLFTSLRQRAPVYDASDEVAVQGGVQDLQQFLSPLRLPISPSRHFLQTIDL